MGYVTENLAPGEHVIYQTHLHWKIFFKAIILTIVALIFFSLQTWNREWPSVVGTILLIWAGINAIINAIDLQTSEFAVTDRRLIMKWGILHRQSIDLRIMQMETILVEQGLIGRILDYGRIVVVGSGGTRQYTPDIADPFAYRLNAQSQSGQFHSFDPSVSNTAAIPRQVRDCPYCAEPILAKARVCKHCGRDVEPLRESETTEAKPIQPSEKKGSSSPSDGPLQAVVATSTSSQKSQIVIEEPLCPGCGKPNQTGTKFCIYCGTRLRQSPTEEEIRELLCPQCNAKNPSTAKFCNECGHSLTDKQNLK